MMTPQVLMALVAAISFVGMAFVTTAATIITIRVRRENFRLIRDNASYVEASAELAMENEKLKEQLAERVKVKQLKWGEYKALGARGKLVAFDCFGNGFARLDLNGQSLDYVEDFKRRHQEAYEHRILSALEATTPSPQRRTNKTDEQA